VQFARVVAFVLLALAALGSFGWPFQWGIRTVLGVAAAGLAAWAVSGLDPPAPPSR
jgi:small-conductance mechanosensitive channel